MYRQFQLTATTSFTTLFDALVTQGYCDSRGNMIVSAALNSAIIPDRVQEMELTPGEANTGTITISDEFNTTGFALTNITKRSNRNSICLRSYRFKGTDTNQVLNLEIESV